MTALFRFHTGSIKRKKGHPEGCPLIAMFRFHTGSIKRRDKILFSLLTEWFRFHTGSIKRNVNRTKDQLNAKVSIPYWFD